MRVPFWQWRQGGPIRRGLFYAMLEGGVVGGMFAAIEVWMVPLLQTRLFSYVDTQLTRLGGPNFNQLPINRTHAPVNDMLRDGMHQTAVHGGVAPYKPNSLDAGCPFFAGAESGHAFWGDEYYVLAKGPRGPVGDDGFEADLFAGL